MKLLKFFTKRSVWSVVLGFFAILTAVAYIGGSVAMDYQGSINVALGIIDYEIVGSDDSDSEYFKSKYVQKDENGEIKYVTDEGGYKHQVYDDEAMRENSIKVARQVVAEGSVLLWNNDALPLAEGSKVSLFGIGTVKYGYFSLGAGFLGTVPERNFLQELEVPVSNGGAGFDVNDKLFSAYQSLQSSYGYSRTNGTATVNPDFNGENKYIDERYAEPKVNEVPLSVLESTTGGVEKTVTGYGDAAIMVLTRSSSEDGDIWMPNADHLNNDYLDLEKNEAETLQKLCALKEKGVIKKIVLILDTPTVMMMENIKKYSVDACIFACHGGMESFSGLGDILSGKANPSGRLVDAIAYNHKSAPATVNFGDFRWTQNGTGLKTDINAYNNQYLVYQEGIYAGYRYYETRYADAVANRGNASSNKGVLCGEGNWKYQDELCYPFGYGIGYTTFEYKNFNVSHDSGERGGTYRISVDVKNTGTIPGKTPVEIYLQKPYTNYDVENKIEKSAIELCGFTKTDIIPAGETVTVTVEVKGEELKTYDAYGKGTYILEKGDYYFAVGSDCHDALNNVLASQGYNSSNGMVDSLGNACNGNASLSYKKTINSNDYETFSTSAETGEKIENQLSSADLNLYDGTKNDQTVTYLSRNDWDATYPTAAVSLKCVNATMVTDMQYGHEDIASEGEMPDLGKVTAPLEILKLLNPDETDEDALKMKLINLRGLDYDHEYWDYLLDQLTFEDMQKLMSQGFKNLNGCTNVAAPSVFANDGANGVASKNAANLVYFSGPANTLLACTWNIDLAEKMGDVYGHECLHANVKHFYAPSVNMHRTPYGGRNVEYFSEDPFMAGCMVAAQVKGIEAVGVMTCVKHFAFNDQEINRCGVATFINEQTAREITLKPWNICIAESSPSSLMSSFPRLGTRAVTVNKGLMTNILRGEWGFSGFVETDSAFGQYYMTHYKARAEGVVAGTDLWMNGGVTDGYALGTPADNKLMWALYEDNATVVRAMRESCHRLLYSRVNSAAMNGISSSSEIVYVTPWWVSAVNTLQITCLCCLIACVLVIVLLSVFNKKLQKVFAPYETKRPKRVRPKTDIVFSTDNRSKDQDTSSGTGKNGDNGTIGGLFNNKKVLITVLSVVAVVVIALAIILPIALSKKPDPTPEEHVCENVCTICGGCNDLDCTDEVCANKCTCATTIKNEYAVDVSDEKVLVEGTDKNVDGNFVAQKDATTPFTITYTVKSLAACEIDLYITLASRTDSYVITAMLYELSINDVKQFSSAVNNATTDNPETTFTEVYLGKFDLQEGENAIVFTAKPFDDSHPAFRGVRIESNTELSFVKKSSFVMYAADENVFVSADLVKDVANNRVTGAGNIVYKIKAESACTVKLSITVSSVGHLIPAASIKDVISSIYVNGTPATGYQGMVPQGADIYENYYIGEFEFKEGVNEVSLTKSIHTWAGPYFRGISLTSSATLSLVNAGYVLNATAEEVFVEGGYKDTVNNRVYPTTATYDPMTLTFGVNVAADCTVDFKVVVSGHGFDETVKLSQVVTAFDINGTAKSITDVDLPKAMDVYSEYSLGRFDLKKGNNVIKITVKQLAYFGPFFRGVNIDSPDEKINFYRAITSLSAADSRVVLSENILRQPENDRVCGDGTITYKLNASKAVKVKLYVSVSSLGQFYTEALPLKQVISSVSVNGTVKNDYEGNVPTGENIYSDYFIGEFDLIAGDNVIVITQSAYTWAGPYFRSITVMENDAVTLVDANA